MAKALKCDRCGTYFDTFEYTDDTVIIATVKQLNVAYGKTFGCAMGSLLFQEGVFTLCPSCQEKLEKFLKGVDYDVVPVMSTEE